MSVLQTGFGNSGGDYTISRSVRLRSSASAYFNRTPASAGNRRTWTYSAWVKLGSLSTTLNLLYAYSADSDSGLCQVSYQSNQLRIQGITASFLMVSTPVYRDPSAWYHLVFKVDTTQATAADRIRVYVNNVEITSWATNSPPAQNTDTAINNNVAHNIGRNTRNSNDYFDGYMTEINVIDGQALTPSSFGETDTITGVWKPKRYTGTYGTNGFYLNFSDNSNNTAATIGKDSSGNGNNWTPNNISVTSGVTYDSMLDTPTPYADGGNGRGNYAVLNPVNKTLYQPTIANGNLNVAPTTTQYQNAFATIAPTSGKWYCEVTVNGTPNSANFIGVSSSTEQNYLTTNAGLVGSTSSGYSYYIYNGNKYSNGSSSSYGDSIASGNVVGIALDLDNGKVWFSKNGTWQASGDPAAGTNAAFTGLTSSLGFFIASTSYSGGSTSFDHNFGQRPFAYTPPTGFKALNTQNLPDATIKKGSAYFDVSPYTATGAAQSIVNSGGFQPDLVWIKSRSNGAYWHALMDSVRGSTKILSSNTTGADVTLSDELTSFNSNGFSLGASSTGYTNNSGTYVGWQWKAGGAAVSNTSGSITSSVSAGATQGFSVVQFTATGSNATVGHGLGVAPAMVIVKDAASTGNWAVYHKSLTSAAYYLYMNTTAAQGNVAAIWNNTAPTSTVFSVGTWHTADRQIAYCFAEVAGFSKFGSYTGNGSTDGPMVYLGLRARWLMIKRTDTSDDWVVLDTSRNTYNVTGSSLFPNSTSAETTNGYYNTDITSNGFKIRSSNTPVNANGGTYIYAAFAENPFKNSLAR